MNLTLRKIHWFAFHFVSLIYCEKNNLWEQKIQSPLSELSFKNYLDLKLSSEKFVFVLFKCENEFNTLQANFGLKSLGLYILLKFGLHIGLLQIRHWIQTPFVWEWLRFQHFWVLSDKPLSKVNLRALISILWGQLGLHSKLPLIWQDFEISEESLGINIHGKRFSRVG